MKKKLILIIISIVLLLAIAITLIVYFVTRKTEEPYKLLKNDDIVYKYISNKEDYLNFLKQEEVNSDSYEDLNDSDFNNKKYLVLIIPFDSCSESINSSKMEKTQNKNVVYLDMSYSCGVCPLDKKVILFETNKELDVEIYTKTVSRDYCDPNVAYKPIIYIYPEEDMDLRIELGKKENLLYTYPKYTNKWNVRVTTDGNIYDYNTKRNYYGLYWEGIDDYKLDKSEGFVVKGEDTVKFLEEKLSILGLNDYEINEFIIYWIDKMEGNKYNFISFRSMEDIEKTMPLKFSIEPDTLIRVMMDYKPLDDYIEVKEQELIPVTRSGYTIVEWGGTIHK